MKPRSLRRAAAGFPFRPAALLSILLAGTLQAPSARPLLADPALGTASAAFAGGGAGDDPGVNAVLANPGALRIEAGHQVELGMMGLSQGLNPYTLLGGRSGDATWALGFFHDGRTGPFRNGLVAGAAREVAPGLALGGALRSQGGRAGYGVDADAGAQWRPRGPALLGEWAVIGATVRDIAESGMGQEPEGYETRRRYALSLGARGGSARILFLPLAEPDAFYEFRAAGLRPEDFSHAFSAGAGFTPTGALFLRATLRLPHSGEAEAALGGFLRLDVGSGAITAGYAFSSGGPGAGTGEPTHSVSFRVALGARADRRPPWVSVAADRVYLRGEAPGSDRVHFRLNAADRTTAGLGPGEELAGPGAKGWGEAKAPGEGESGGRGEIKAWTLSICEAGPSGSGRRPVRTFEGRDLPPRLIRWEGRDDRGEPLAPGFYAFRLSAEDKAGNKAATAWQLIELGVGKGMAGGAGAAGAGVGEAGKGTASGADDNGVRPPALESEDR